MVLRCPKCGCPVKLIKKQGDFVILRCTVCYRTTKILKSLYEKVCEGGVA